MLRNLKVLIYGLIIAFLVVGIILLKSYTYENSSTLIYGYAFLITVFMLSRIMGSFFYIPYNEKVRGIYGKNLDSYLPTVSFVIPCKNEEECIYHTITSCLTGKYPRDKIEVIAINDGSTDNTLKEMMRAKKDSPAGQVHIVNFKINKGKREGMAYGMDMAKGEIIVQMDSDSYQAPDALKKLIEPFIDRKVGAVVGHTDPSNKDENLITKIQTAYYFMSFRALKATESIFDMVFCCSGCYSAYRKEYIMRIKEDWLNEKFMGKTIVFGDDRALTNWVIRLGYKTVYVDNAQAFTVVPNTLRKFMKQQVRWKKGWLINSVKITPEIVKRDKFVAFTYLIPLIFITILTPIIAFKVFVINPIFLDISPLYYMTGVFMVSFILLFHYKIYNTKDSYGKYMIAYSILNMTILTYIMIYALYDLKNMKWGTR